MLSILLVPSKISLEEKNVLLPKVCRPLACFFQSCFTHVVALHLPSGPGSPPGLSSPVDTTSSTLLPLRLARRIRSRVTSDQKTSSRRWWKSRAMAFSRLLSSSVYSERCGRTCRMSMRLANSSTGSGPGTWHRNGAPTGLQSCTVRHAPLASLMTDGEPGPLRHVLSF